MKQIFKMVFMLSCLIILSIQANAYFITSSGDASLSGANVIDFSSQALGSFTSLTIGDLTFSVAPNKVGDITDGWNGSYNATGRSMENQQNGNSFSSIRFDFAAPASAFGFNMGASNEDWVLSAYNAGNVLLESFTLPQTWWSNAGEFYGIAISNMSYLTLTQVTHVTDSGVDWIIMDNFKYAATSAIPEPVTLLLLGLGLMGVAGIRRTMKK